MVIFSAAATSNAGNANGGFWIYYVFIAVMFIAMYFFTIRPQNKKEKELKNLRNNLAVGDEIMTIGGFYGTIVRIKEDRVTIATGAEKTKVEIARAAISTVLNREIPAPGKADDVQETTEKISPKSIRKLSKKEQSEEE